MEMSLSDLELHIEKIQQLGPIIEAHNLVLEIFIFSALTALLVTLWVMSEIHLDKFKHKIVGIIVIPLLLLNTGYELKQGYDYYFMDRTGEWNKSDGYDSIVILSEYLGVDRFPLTVVSKRNIINKSKNIAVKARELETLLKLNRAKFSISDLSPSIIK